MITMNWKKDAAGRLAAEWKDAGTENLPVKTTGRYHKALRMEMTRRVLAPPRLRKTWH